MEKEIVFLKTKIRDIDNKIECWSRLVNNYKQERDELEMVLKKLEEMKGSE